MRLLVASLSLVFLISFQTSIPTTPSGETTVKERNAGKKTDNTKAEPEKPATPLVPGRSNNKETDDRHRNESNAYNPQNDTLYRVYLWATILGFIIGLAGIVALICQTIASRTAANAANLNAQAVINAERALIMVQISSFDHDTLIIKAINQWSHPCENNPLRCPLHVSRKRR